MRDGVAAILTGADTVLADDPRLTAAGGRHPLRVILDSRLREPKQARVFTGPGRALVATSRRTNGNRPGPRVSYLRLKRGKRGLDLKALLSRELQTHPDMMNRIFQQAGAVELQSVINRGAIIGGILGALLVPLWTRYPEPWLLPLGGFVVGFVTNWIAINLIFAPLKPRRILFWKVQGLFLRRQPEISDVWARLVAEELITVEKVADAMINGSHGDRTRAIIQKHLRPLLDNSVIMKLTAQVTVGMTGYTELKKVMNQKAVLATRDVFSDPAFNRERAPVVAEVLSGQMKALKPDEFQDILRPAFREEEVQLMIVGGIFGALAGLLQFVSLNYLNF